MVLKLDVKESVQNINLFDTSFCDFLKTLSKYFKLIPASQHRFTGIWLYSFIV